MLNKKNYKKNNKIKKVLIANRSEIVSRIIYTCRALEISPVVIYTQQDALLSYINLADDAYKLPGEGFSAYISQDEIIKIAHKSGADAIHPGYGFLAESNIFAQKVTDSGLIWVGPDPDCINLMGNKIQAKNIMAQAGVPTVPWHNISCDSPQVDTLALNCAQELSFPVVIKDPLSGGGKAMRIAYSPKEFEAALSTVLSESKRLTGAKNILIEKYIKLGRHIEIQIAGDGENYIHLFERECSIQRRNQKVIEESPCCFISQKTKETLYRAALLAAKSVNYKNIGTVEFIVTPEEKFYFLEVNTRLQVEHSVTEMTTGIDLVALQFQIAQDKKLLYTQEDIKHNGHAIECRIYSEDPERNFLPTTGAITNIALPTGPFTRTDCAVYNGYTVTPHFDPMLAKVTVYGYTRDHAIKYLKGLLERSSISGVITNINLLCQLLETTEFTLGKIHTKLLSDQNFIKKILSKPSQETSQEILPDLSCAQEIKEEILAGCALILLEELTQEKIIKRQESSWRTSHLDNFYKNY